jgi:pimeloyl-ACP methyl ester carboxylesterase
MFRFLRYLIIFTLIAISVFSLIGWLSDGFGIEKPEKPFANSEFIKINGVEIHYRKWLSETDTNKGTVVLIHGFCGSTFNWRNTIDTLTKNNFNIIALDLPAFGYSDRSKGIDHSNSNRIKITLKLLSEIFPNEEKFHFVGHSMGGGMVAQLSSLYPEKVASSSLVAAAIMMPQSKGFFSFMVNSAPFRGFTAILAKYYLFSESNIKTLVTSAYNIEATNEAIQGYRNPLLLKRTSGAILDQFVKTENNKTTELEKISIPTLIIWGEKDNWVPLSWSDYIVKTIPNAQLNIINEAGHCPMETHPKQFNEILLNFIVKNAAKTN